MKKIKDRDTLSIVSGLLGQAGIILVDTVSRRANLSKRSYREAAAGVFVSKREARTVRGQALGTIMNSAVSILGANYIIKRLSQNGRDSLISKGITSGIIFGAIATTLPNIAPWNKMKPKDATSNLSYVFSNLVFGLIATFAAAKLGHDSLYDVPPQNDYMQPTEKTSAQIKEAEKNAIQQPQPDANSKKENGASIFN